MKIHPEKLYFKIGEVAHMTGVKPHVLRYWESEFTCFRPAKTRKNQRIYQQKDVDLVLKLKELLYQQGYTIAGAKAKLQNDACTPLAGQALPAEPSDTRSILKELRSDLSKLRDSMTINL
ncbi:MAG TPA: MerR family transcriptional regulator [Desulfobacteraceae bacterium]|nr:MerR family transcriptional regulator [Desulfuromonadales bacterium]MDW7756527.1 MerR family transcriptional regulator [Desulfuromonadales bacterium]HER62449.1 MerR family transcriptional regulator [Desulfobacteraceae bacterium]